MQSNDVHLSHWFQDGRVTTTSVFLILRLEEWINFLEETITH